MSRVRNNLPTYRAGHPVWLRCSPLKYSRYSRASRLASRAPRSGIDQNYWINPAAFAAPAPGTFGNAPRDLVYNPGEQQWDMAFFKNFRVGRTQKLQFRAEMFNFINHPNWDNATSFNTNNGSIDPSNANFGRITTKRDERRDVQLSLRYVF